MGVPANVVFVQGQGAASSDELNSMTQVVVSVAQLRAFPALTNMLVYLLGYTAVADGGQGFFVWNGTTTGADNGTTLIRPNGVTVGAWVRIPSSLQGPFSAIFLTWTGVQASANTWLGGISAEIAFTIPAGLTGFVGGTPKTLPTADYTITIKKVHAGVTTTLGTVTYVVLSGLWTVSFASAVPVAIGDEIDFYGPGDTTIADFKLTVKVSVP